MALRNIATFAPTLPLGARADYGVQGRGVLSRRTRNWLGHRKGRSRIATGQRSHAPLVMQTALRSGARRYSLAQRDSLGLHGRVHPRPPLSLEEDVARLMVSLREIDGEPSKAQLRRYELLMHTLDRDMALFFAAAERHIEEILPMVYTPAVGTACVNYSKLNVPLRGLWIGYDRRGSVESILNAWVGDVDVIVVSDGERILGLGDLAANGHGIPVGKLLLYTVCAGVDPNKCLPVTLDVGCNNESVRADKFYIGLDQERVRGEEYYAFIEEFVRAARSRFGESVLIHWEDFGNSNAMKLLNMYKERICCFNDDIQGTAAVALAGVLSALRMEGVKQKLGEHKVLFLGAGSAGLGIADLIVQQLVTEGIPRDEARKRCYFIDTTGLIYKGRERVSTEKERYAHEIGEELKSVAKEKLVEVVKAIRPSALIGVSTMKGAFNEEVIKTMCAHNERPMIFALSNPTEKSECTAEEAYTLSEGKAVFASGSPFKPVKLPGASKALVPGQGNNAFVFPGLGLGVIVSGARHVTERMVLSSAIKLAELVDQEQLDVGCVYPPLSSLTQVSAEIAMATAEQAKRDGVATVDITKLSVDKIRKQMYAPTDVNR